MPFAIQLEQTHDSLAFCRYKYDNIINMELDMPDRTTEVWYSSESVYAY